MKRQIKDSEENVETPQCQTSPSSEKWSIRAFLVFMGLFVIGGLSVEALSMAGMPEESARYIRGIVLALTGLSFLGFIFTMTLYISKTQATHLSTSDYFFWGTLGVGITYLLLVGADASGSLIIIVKKILEVLISSFAILTVVFKVRDNAARMASWTAMLARFIGAGFAGVRSSESAIYNRMENNNVNAVGIVQADSINSVNIYNNSPDQVDLNRD
ncbi:uncharacterized membrane protein YjfL (UPF0719 family) [Lipingzhangella halophila]|uniref:Uncharacterized membrane protein YjfL (UPF0719 family) n=1 Tax=Lipingzhangella halophila TaxID=1783352 RepID=A0A7W7RKT6_9ACTN|nr:hypothetical protein [Lipingzhangella halophila]MBB4933756.1 uncharacterized membrane protein YjfL (UPF0719 family) [Lipingzhangella halophila]